ncbi:MAG TPA: Zn-binding domain-containing protein, partial [Tepidisphaeraceae bacterium]|nr:Zn-binding domain-containing protein [Tepidisphaeraceae bacterium]
SPIDQFLMNHSDYLFSKNPENAIIDPDNPHLALGHLRCALRELPLRPGEEHLFGGFTQAMLQLLSESGRARSGQGKWFTQEEGFPAAEINLRNADAVIYTIMEATEGGSRVIGTIDESSAHSQVHDHAVYLHGGETYFTQKLDLQKKIAYVERKDLDYYTQAVSESLIRIDSTEETQDWRKSTLSRGDVTVTTLVTMFKKIKFHSRDSLGYENLALPPQTLETAALWLVPGVPILGRAAQYGLTPMEGLVGIANLMLEVIPLFVMGDVQDVGGVVEASNLGQPTIFIYDKYVGGVGYAEKAYELLEKIMQACLQIAKECRCQTGCPSCVGSAHPAPVQRMGDGESRDRIPSKEAALVILHELLEIPGYVPRLLLAEAVSAAPALEAGAIPAVTQQKLPPNMEQRLRKRLKSHR